MSSYVCPECGLDYDTISPLDGTVAIRSFPRRYRSTLAEALEDEADESLIRRRPQPDVWSALEYTAHVVDVFAASAGWVREVRMKDRPTLAFPSDRLFPTVEGGGGSTDDTLRALATAAEDLAKELDRVEGDGWQRVGSYPWGERDVLATMRNAVHEGSHHLRDVDRVLTSVRGRP